MAKKISLREFQESVVAKLQSVASAEFMPGLSRLGVQVGAQNWLVDLADVSEVVPLPAMVPVPLTHRWFSGLANVRGVLYGVVDFGDFLGGEPMQPSLDRRLLLANARFAVNSGIVVNRVLGLRNLEQMQRRDAGSDTAWVAAEYVDADGREWKELDMRRLVEDTGFLNVGL